MSQKHIQWNRYRDANETTQFRNNVCIWKWNETIEYDQLRYCVTMTMMIQMDMMLMIIINNIHAGVRWNEMRARFSLMLVRPRQSASCRRHLRSLLWSNYGVLPPGRQTVQHLSTAGWASCVTNPSASTFPRTFWLIRVLHRIRDATASTSIYFWPNRVVSYQFDPIYWHGHHSLAEGEQPAGQMKQI